MKRQLLRKQIPYIYGLLLILIVIGVLEGLMQGYTSYSPVQLYEGLVQWIQGDTNTHTGAAIIGELRLPRIMMAVAVGMGLSTSGVVMQSLFRNPMADPYILGISSGAALGIVICVTLGLDPLWGPTVVPIGAFLGAASISLISVFASRLYNHNPRRFLMIGVALGAVCGGLTGVLIFIGAGHASIDVTLYWMMGSIAFVPLQAALVSLVVALICTLFFMTQIRMLNIMKEGPAVAITLGRPVHNYVTAYVIINAILVGAIVMNSGIIGFVGLLIPHLCRLFVGSDARVVLPLSALLGMVVTVFADILGRTVIPGVDIPLGILFAVIGAPVFVGILIQRQR